MTYINWLCLRITGDNEIQNNIQGRVKWFNAAKGFGFVVSDQPGPDILIHINVLRAFGHNTITEGARIELVAQESPRGLQATEVVSITPTEDPDYHEPHYAPPTHAVNAATTAGQFEPARIKWFDKARGFGFVTIFGSTSDVFVHMETLRQCHISDLQAGEAVAVRVAEGPRGKMVAEIRPWESVLLSESQPPESDIDTGGGEDPE